MTAFLGLPYEFKRPLKECTFEIATNCGPGYVCFDVSSHTYAIHLTNPFRIWLGKAYCEAHEVLCKLGGCSQPCVTDVLNIAYDHGYKI